MLIKKGGDMCRRLRWLSLALPALFILCAPAFARGDGLIAERQLLSSTGQELTVRITVTWPGELTAIGIRETVPAGWEFSGLGGDTPPLLIPELGTRGKLEFAWLFIPRSPISFTYTVRVGEGDVSLDANFTGEVEYRRRAGALLAEINAGARNPDR